jgi:glycosyltransferase involved in cell wall biosynthesis
MNVGGVAVLLDNLMSNFDPEQFEALLVSGVCESPEAEYLSKAKSNYSLITVKRFHKSLNFIDDLLSFFEICRIIRNFKPNIIHTHTSKAGLFGRVAAIIVRPSAKRIHTFHGHLLVGYFGSLKLALVKGFERNLGRISSGLIAMGTQVRDDLVAARIAPFNKFKVAFPGISITTFPPRVEARKNFELAPEKIYCAFIGRLTEVKRPDRVLDVARITQRENPAIRFLVVGDGELEPSLRSLSELESLPIEFLGWRNDVASILAASDLLLLTSDNEAVALTLIEAANAGIPIVTTPAGSVRDIAKDGVNGYVTTFDPDSIARAIIELASDSKKRTEMGLAGREIANRLFSISSMVESHQKYYMEILSI